MRKDYAILAMQRNLRIYGLFVKLVKEDKKGRYQQYLPTVRKYLQQDANNEFITSHFGEQSCLVKSLLH